MATIKFFLKGKNDPSIIYVRYRDGRRIDITASTSITIKRKYWGKTGLRRVAEFDGKMNIQNELTRLEHLIVKKRNEAVTKQIFINTSWLKEIISRWQGKNADLDIDLFINTMNSYCAFLPNRIMNGKKGVSSGTLKNYKTTLSRLAKYEDYTKRRLLLSQVDLIFHGEYLKFATSALGLAPNSIGKDISNIKAVCRWAKDRGLNVNDHVFSRNFNSPREATIFTTLNEEELKKIKYFKGPNYLENAKNWLIIGCWTGCRVGDLMKLSKENIFMHNNGRKYIRYIQSKTMQMVNVPIHPDVQEIIEQCNGFPRPISSVKFNEYIKEVCYQAGLTQLIYGTKQNSKTHLKETGTYQKWELIKSHTCRRSFATNHYNKLPNKVIMAVTGHATEKMLLNYIGEVENDHLEDFIDFWESKLNNTKYDN